MNAKQFAALLVELNACSEAREWASGKSLAVVWKTCKRGDWLLWLCGRMEGKKDWPTHKEIVLAACDCAELSLKHVPPGEDRPRKCIEVVRAWVRGETTIEEVRVARTAAAYAVEYAAAYAATAAYAVEYAAATAAFAVEYAATAAATAAARAAANAALCSAASAASARRAIDAARTKTLAKCATLVRKRLKIGDV